MATWKQIETSREIRQWIKGIVLPVGAGALYLDFKYPDLKYKIKDSIKLKYYDLKYKFSKKEPN